MTPYEAPDLFYVIVLGSAVSPGKATLSGHDRNPAWDKQAAKGSTGATTKRTDPKPPGEFTVTFDLADASEIDAWDEFQIIVESTFAGPEPVALPIYHPDLARNGFTEVVALGITGMVHDRTGGARVAVKFGEYRPPAPSPTQAAGARASSGNGSRGGAPYDPNAAARREFGELWDEVNTP